MWAAHDNVKLCVHCGVGNAGKICLEQRAHNFNYVRADNKNTSPPNGVCVVGAPMVLETSVNLPLLMEHLRASHPDIDKTIGISTNAGRYLFEFTFFHSLSLHKAPTLFVHVPPFSDMVTVDYLRTQLVRIISAALEVIDGKRAGLLRPQVMDGKWKMRGRKSR